MRSASKPAANTSGLPGEVEKAMRNLILSPDGVKEKRRLMQAVQECSLEGGQADADVDMDQVFGSISRMIFELVKSDDVASKLGGVAAMDALIEVECEQRDTLITRFANYLRLTLPCGDVITMQRASIVMGHLARCGNELTRDFVDFEVRRALEALSATPRSEPRRLAAAFVLRELAKSVPSLFFEHAPAFLKVMWWGVRDPSQLLRESTVEALREVLSLLSDRSSKARGRWIVAVYTETMRGFEACGGDPAAAPNRHVAERQKISLHGHLLVMRELLDSRHEAIIKGSRLDEVFDVLMVHRSDRDTSVHASCIRCMWALARFDTVGLFVGPCISHLLAGIAAGEGNTAGEGWEAVGRIIAASPSGVARPWLTHIVTALERFTTGNGDDAAAVECLGVLCACVPVDEDTAVRVGKILERVVVIKNLNDITVESLTRICDRISSLRGDIELLLLDEVSKSLSGERYVDSTPYWKIPPQTDITLGTPTKSDASSTSSSPWLSRVTSGVEGGANFGRPSLELQRGRPSLELQRGRPSLELLRRPRFVSDTGVASSQATDATKTSPQKALDFGQQTGPPQPPRPFAMAAMRVLLTFDFNGGDAYKGGHLEHKEEEEEIWGFGSKRGAGAGAAAGPGDSGYHLTDLVATCVAPFLSHKDGKLRAMASRVCLTLMVPKYGNLPRGGRLELITTRVLACLLRIGVSDPDPGVRIAVMGGLEDRHLRYLSSRESVQTLLMALNDSNFEVREIAVTCLGKVARVNPGCTLPHMRHVMLELLASLESGQKSDCSDSARLLTFLIPSCKAVVIPFAPQILSTIVPHLTDRNKRVSANCLKILGLLSAEGGEAAAMALQTDIFPTIIDALHDRRNLSRRMEAAIALSRVVRGKGAEAVERISSSFPGLYDALAARMVAEPSLPVRKELLRAIGTLGAMSPDDNKVTYHKKMKSKGGRKGGMEHGGKTDASDAFGVEGHNAAPRESEVDLSTACAMEQLIRVLRDASFSSLHMQAIQSIVLIFRFEGNRCASMLPEVMTPLLAAAQQPSEGGKNEEVGRMRDFALQQIPVVMNCVGSGMAAFLPELLALVNSCWAEPSMQHHALSILEETARGINHGLKPHIKKLLPMLLGILNKDASRRCTASCSKALDILLLFGSDLQNSLHLVLAAALKLGEDKTAPHELRSKAIMWVSGSLSGALDFRSCSGSVMHSLCRIIAEKHVTIVSAASLDSSSSGSTRLGPGGRVRADAMTCVRALARALGPDYLCFVPSVSQAMASGGMQDTLYDSIVEKLERGEDPGVMPRGKRGKKVQGQGRNGGGEGETLMRGGVNHAVFMKAFEVTLRSTKDDWRDWMRGLKMMILRENPSPALRACAPLAQLYEPMANDLFNPAFHSCWMSLPVPERDSVLKNIERAFSPEWSPNIPNDLLHKLLVLADFMERHDLPLPISGQVLLGAATRCRAFAKSLRYLELDFRLSARRSTREEEKDVEPLMSLYQSLSLPEASNGILAYARKKLKLALRESWYEMLHMWEDALSAYRRSASHHDRAPVDWEGDGDDKGERVGEGDGKGDGQGHVGGKQMAQIGCMRCLFALGEWEELSVMASNSWDVLSEKQRRRCAPLAAASAWHLGRLSDLISYVTPIERQSFDGCFYRALMYMHQGKLDEAEGLLDEARDALDAEVPPLLRESYERAYPSIVKAQQVVELEEAIDLSRRFGNGAARRGGPEQTKLEKVWEARLKIMKHSVDSWQECLAVHRTVVGPDGGGGHRHAWLQFASVCRRNGREQLCRNTLLSVIGWRGKEGESEPGYDVWAASGPDVSLAWAKHRWTLGLKEDAVKTLKAVIEVPKNRRLSVHSNEGGENLLAGGDIRLARAKCLVKLGRWVSQEKENGVGDDVVFEALTEATVLAPSWVKAWHNLAMFHFRQVDQREAAGGGLEDLMAHVVPAVQAFHRSLSLSRTASHQQDAMRFLTLWFKYGSVPELTSAMEGALGSLPIDTWLDVVPQIIARINLPDTIVRGQIHDLLFRIGREHPQVLIYPLTVAGESPDPVRKEAGRSLLHRMSTVFPELVQQGVIVSRELVRVSVLLHETWAEGLDDASRLLREEHDTDSMKQELRVLHSLYTEATSTSDEMFLLECRDDIEAAERHLDEWEETGADEDLTQAWESYLCVFRVAHRIKESLKSVDLSLCSPMLLECRDLELAMPGQYRPGHPIVGIRSVSQHMPIISSKQKPRKCTMEGSDGRVYSYLLKGHEDLRQDERVMQLFGLVNSCLGQERECARRDLRITRYAVMPLSPKSGLIEWVPDCDTMHDLIKKYREPRQVPVALEHRMLLTMAHDYDSVPVIQKMEAFEHVINNTRGDDIDQILWRSSLSAEDWLDRRTRFTRSLGTMSMVGYVLGLGDRHPSNVMIQKLTGMIVHIDFGDCFEVAMERSRFPERVPFRLTRMFINAMEVSGVEGIYRTTCEQVMGVLRSYKNSMMAMLQAFVHDPLISQRLLQTKSSSPKKTSPAQHPAPPVLPPVPGSAGLMIQQASFAKSTQSSASSSIRRMSLSRRPSTTSDKLNVASPSLACSYIAASKLVISKSGTLQGDDPVVGKGRGGAQEEGEDCNTSCSSTTTASNALRQRLVSDDSVEMPSASLSSSENSFKARGGAEESPAAGMKGRALIVMDRVQQKLTGTDFQGQDGLSVEEQVDLLIKQATLSDNLCQSYVGWCPFW